MRRPLLMIFIFILIFDLILTNLEYYNDDIKTNYIKLEGTITNKEQKERYDEYVINKYLIRDYSKQKNMEIGNKIVLIGSLKSMSDMKFDHFDYGKYILSKGYSGIVDMKSYYINGKDNLYISIGKLKNHIKNTIKYLYKDNSEFINSLILGEKNELSKEQRDTFSRTGTSHVIAISGLHIGVICVLATFIIGGINRVYKFIILIIFMILYYMMVGGSPSIFRAIMFTVILYLSVFLDRKRDGISALSLIGIILVINNPYIIYNISFQLSFLSTLSIIYFYAYINKKVKISLISLTLASNILTLPIVYYNFKGIPVASLIGNIIIVPFIAIIMYMSIISVVLFNINLSIAKIIVYINDIIIDTIYSLLNIISNLEFVYIQILNPKIDYVIIYYIIVFIYMIYKEKKVIKEQLNELQAYYTKP